MLLSVIKGVKVKSIGKEAFYNCESVIDVTLPDTITDINEGAFNGCSNLKSINIPSNITSISKDVFGGCKNLLQIEIPEGVTSIGDTAFFDSNNLKSMIIPDSLASVGTGCFGSYYSIDGSLSYKYKSNDTLYYIDSDSVKQILINAGVDESKIILNRKIQQGESPNNNSNKSTTFKKSNDTHNQVLQVEANQIPLLHQAIAQLQIITQIQQLTLATII